MAYDNWGSWNPSQVGQVAGQAMGSSGFYQPMIKPFWQFNQNSGFVGYQPYQQPQYQQPQYQQPQYQQPQYQQPQQPQYGMSGSARQSGPLGGAPVPSPLNPQGVPTLPRPGEAPQLPQQPAMANPNPAPPMQQRVMDDAQRAQFQQIRADQGFQAGRDFRQGIAREQGVTLPNMVSQAQAGRPVANTPGGSGYNAVGASGGQVKRDGGRAGSKGIMSTQAPNPVYSRQNARRK